MSPMAKFTAPRPRENKMLSTNPESVRAREYSHSQFGWDAERRRIRTKHRTRKSRAIQKLQGSKEYLKLKEEDRKISLDRLTMQLDNDLDQELEAEYRNWLHLVHEEQSSSEDEGEEVEADEEKDIETVDQENSETECEKASSDFEFEETEEWQGIVSSEEDEEEWAGLETDQSQGSDGNIEAETMGEDLAKGLHVIWKHWQGHFEESLKYYTKIGQIEDSEVQDGESLA
jgi:hypothetical protein